MRESSRIFILGLGHQKCGTSWLYDYLCQSSHFCKGIAKEYHIWDAIDIPILKKNKVGKENFNSNAIQSTRYAMQNNPNVYFEYFSSLYSNNNTITADITPSYSGLKVKRLEQIKNEFKKRGVKVKAVILIRDPLGRIKSAVRFNLDRKNYNEGSGSGVLDFTSALGMYYKSEHCTLRTNYEEIITQAEQVFSEEELYIGIYENMFTQSEMLRMSIFLEVDLIVQYADITVNKTLGIAEKTTIDDAIKAQYMNVYRFCFNRYPITRDLWGA